MTATATRALQLAQRMLDTIAASDIDNQGIEIDGKIHTADEIRSVLRRGLESLRQGPLMLDALGVDTRLRQASRKAGSDAALARAIGISRQALADVMSGKRQPGPAVLGYLRLRKVATGRTLYTPMDDEVRPKAPRSERRQRAWDGPSVAVPDSVAAP
ncbi:helix-turn-helix domain-containing protein [Devosia sediminis]|uniref:Helix-turn-helix transcriptional regulator n=1 Tax=Devosia sediminis TaxID=2798801 RepID=A0A934MH02_9HYPH|nr:helix-turn-helix transcriptional regulator [Devosia sediminis]MBJ3784502.1 helix-turn-helix transcriptional regulator [Devosia sediminis]